MPKDSAAVLTKESALKISDLKVAMSMLRELGVDPKGKGIKSLDDAIKLICIELDSRKGGVVVQDSTKGKHSRGLQKAIEDDKKSREKLCQKYENVHQFYTQLPKGYQQDLKQVFPGLENDFVGRKQELNMTECTIMIVGETAAGKSSLVNLLLGGIDLLPVSTLGCTATICEIRHSKDGRSEAIAYYRSMYEGGRKGKKPPRIFDLSSSQALISFQKCLTEVDEDGDSPYDRVELNWPFPMLEEGIVIVDTPGIGGGGKLGKYAERYLAKSYGLIYVINSANAGGVQKGRLQHFMRLVNNAAGEDGFSGDSTLFVCNRWEQVPEGDRDDVFKGTIEKLSKFYKNLKSSQVHCMSVTEASKALHYGAASPENTQLLELVEKLLPTSLRTRLNMHYRWMSAILKRSMFSLKVSKVMAAKDMEKARNEYEAVQKSIDRLERNSQDSINYMKSNIVSESLAVANGVKEALRTRKIAERLYDWHPDNCPRTDDKKKVGKEAIEKIAGRIALEVNNWEKEMKVVRGIKEKIVRVCKRDFELLEGQMAKLEGVLLDGDTKVVQDLHKSIKKPAPVKQLWKKAKDGSTDEDTGTFKGLGGAIASVATVTASDREIKNIFKDYKPKEPAKCAAKMQEATEVYLKSIFESKSLQEKINKFFTRFTKGIDAVAKMIPDFLKSDLQLIDILREQMQGQEGNLRETFPRLISECQVLQGKLDIFFVNEIMKFDYQIDELDWDPSEPAIGSGSFAEVYVAEMRSVGRKGKIPVALKVCRDILRENTVTDILLEDRTLRDLDHPNVVRYYGASYRYSKTRKQDVQWIMIMEMCKWTLKQKFVTNPDTNPAGIKNPGQCPSDSVMQEDAMCAMATFAKQLCDGLCYLHEKGFVHRDLKLENILVTEKNEIKLTDVGLAKHSVDIAYSMVGSPVYMAPEVLLQTQNYDHKADIYSLAIVLWEMWYGKDAADHIQPQLFGPLERAIKDGLRPSLKIPAKPPREWMDIITSSWEYDPNKRPAIDTHLEFFSSVIRGSKSMGQMKM